MEAVARKLNRLFEKIRMNGADIELPQVSAVNGNLVIELRDTTQIIKPTDNLGLCDQPHHPWISLNGMMFIWYGRCRVRHFHDYNTRVYKCVCQILIEGSL
ncbi:hypothetical protein VPHK469_0122 [Vibrio phage K469]